MSYTSYINIDPSADLALADRLLSTSFAGTALAGTPETDTDFASGILVSADKASFDTADDLPEPDESATDGACRVKAYRLADCAVFVTSGDVDGLDIYPADTSIKSLLRDWDTGDLSMAEHLASWGFDGTPDAANESATDVRIWCEPNYYVGTLGAPIGHYVYEEDTYDRDPLVFATVADAQAWIDRAESGTYYLSHGEAGRPAYTICG